MRHFTINKQEKLPINKASFWYTEIAEYINTFPIYDLYNKVRNHLTKKPFSTEKIKLNFDNGTLLDGWDRNKEKDNARRFILKKGVTFI